MIPQPTYLPEIPWPHLPILERLGLALSLGLFIGIERERRHKEAGLRTFAFACLMGCLGSLLGDSYALLSLTLLGVLVTFLNLQTLRLNQGTELTTSAALIVTGFAGVMAGLGHTLTPVAVIVVATALLAWKERLAGFSVGISEPELRSAVLLAILAFVVYPALPSGTIGPWNLIEPRAAWITVLLIAGMGFGNYVLWKLYAERGMELTGFLGGLVNSTVTVSELAKRARENPSNESVYRGIVLATPAMALRNAVLLLLLAPKALLASSLAFTCMLGASLVIILWDRYAKRDRPPEMAPTFELTSPFSLGLALKYGIFFLALQILETVAQRFFGQTGTYVTSFFGGWISSASAVAAAGNLAAKQTLSPIVAGNAAVIASITSAVINLPLVLSSNDRKLIRRLALAISVIVLCGVLGAVLQEMLWIHFAPEAAVNFLR